MYTRAGPGNPELVVYNGPGPTAQGQPMISAPPPVVVSNPLAAEAGAPASA